MRIDSVSPAVKINKAGGFEGSNADVSAFKIAQGGAVKRQDNIPLEQKLSAEISIAEKAWLEMVQRANQALQGVDKRFEFSIHEQTREIMVKVLNNETSEVIREIPPEKILDLIAKIWELAGIFVDEKR